MAVYFIQDADGHVKIGRAEQPEKRLLALQTAHARELKILRTIEGGPVEEWECQYHFRSARIRGEWFEFREEMLSFNPRGYSKLAILRTPSDADQPESLVAFVRGCVRRSPMPQHQIAKLMGYRPSQLSRKLSQSRTDSAKFTLDDLEKYIVATGDTSPIAYLTKKYLTETDEAALLRKIQELESQLSSQRRR